MAASDGRPAPLLLVVVVVAPMIRSGAGRKVRTHPSTTLGCLYSSPIRVTSV